MLSLSTDSPPTSSLFRFFRPDGEPLEGPQEWSVGLIAVDVAPEDLEGSRLERNGDQLSLKLQRVAGSWRAVADWPLSGTGNYLLELRRPQRPPASVVWTVKPIKISEEQYAAMLDSLDSELPVSIAVGLKRVGALAGVELLPPSKTTIGQEMVRLRRAVDGHEGNPGLVRTLVAISRDPHSILTTTDLWIHRDRSRRILPRGLVEAARSAGNLDRNGRPLRVPDSRAEPTADVYENRLVKTFYEQVEQRLRRLVPILGDTPKRAALLEEANDMLGRLTASRRVASFLDEVRPMTQGPSVVTMVLLKRPDYRLAFEGYLSFRRSAAVQIDEPRLESPLRNLPHLYETWATLRVIECVLNVAADLGYEATSHRLVRKDASGIFVRVLADGKAAVVFHHPAKPGMKVELIPQRRYGTHGHLLRSTSFPQKPDVALEISAEDSRHVAIFDPKYKLVSEINNEPAADGKPQKTDIDKMHTYRDAIRSIDGSRVVSYAGILYPGKDRPFTDGLGAISAVPGAESGFGDHLRGIVERALAIESTAESESGLPPQTSVL